MATKKKPKKKESVKEEVIEQEVASEPEVEIRSLEATIAEKFSAEYVMVFKKLAYEVAVVGLSEEEACVIVNFDYTKLVQMKQEHDEIHRLFELKSLEYKRGLMKTLSTTARNGDDKLAQWLLEAKYPGEFNRRKGTGKGKDDDGEDLLGAAIELIQKSTAPNGLVQESSGRAFLVKGKSGDGKVPMNIHESLAGRAKQIADQIDKEKGIS